MYSCDEFIQHAVMTVCKTEGLLVYITSDRSKFDELIDRTREKQLEPILVFGAPDSDIEGFSAEDLTATRKDLMRRFPEIPLVQLASPLDFIFTLQSFKDGVRAVLPKPFLTERRETFVEDIINFLKTFQSYIHSCYNAERREHFASMRNYLTSLRFLSKAPEISLAILQFISELFDRSLTLIVDKNSLVAERSLGILAAKEQGVAAAQKFRIPVPADSILQTVMNSGEIFYGSTKDKTLEEHLFPEIGAPLESTFLLAPLQSNDRTITITYADFGNENSKHVPVDFIEFFVNQAGVAMENALFRRQLKPSKPQE